MPRFICKRCAREYWGWGVSHMYRAGKRLLCPDCEGVLVEKEQGCPAVAAGDGFFDGPEAA